MPDHPSLKNFLQQAEACDELGSPFTAALCRLLAHTVDDGSAFGRRIVNWPDTARADAMPLRVCGALHALARSGTEPVLTAQYPPHRFDREALRTAIKGAITRHDQFLCDYLDSPPQTNEVARSAIILGGMLIVAREMDMPLEILEIGSSAGLNLMFDSYSYDLGNSRHWGRTDAPLTIACDWRGEIPALDVPLTVRSRAGCDQNPLDPRSERTVERLLSYVWADQFARMERLTAAFGHAARTGLTVKKADAADWLETRLARPQATGITRVLFHTIVWQYLPKPVQGRAAAAIAGAAMAATAERPFAHLAYEGDNERPGGAVRLTLWPGGESRFLGRADFHGRWVEWN
ncbi:DUF2332 domain-containing protein [Devosia nitrariae]|uniref:DUF2332 domain-containing protein n=1 Tax=Devosia nitrariae TaxID=2071872 RepID=A0ABQ5W462_9HYPH|nr:DUF2332 family protein [Devosia nitrariae]GLQ54857.1 hypothetical protein GCM10010862_21160 [Devosia nitrariae]